MRFLLLALCVLIAAGNAAARTLVHAGRLIDGNSDRVRERVTIVVDGKRIVEVVDGFQAAATGDDVIALEDHTVMPGLMDMHVHLTSQLSRASYMERFTLNPTDAAIRATAHAHRTLLAGFTTVRNLGDDGMTTVSLRNAINAGVVTGPRIYTAGKSIATTGGHADPTNGLCDDLRGEPGPREGVINGADDAREAVRQRYQEGANLIKVTATGGVLSLASSGQNAQFTDEELKVIVETAKDYGFTVAAHAHGAEGMLRAVNAGVTSIEHGSYMNDEIMSLMKKKGTYYVPTLLAGITVHEYAQEENFLPEIVKPKAAEIGPVVRGTFTKAYKAGVKVAFGTDTGVSRHGDNAREFELMVEYGMPAMAAIRAATVESAKLLRVEKDLGTIEKGKLADLVAVQGDPLTKISLMRDVRFVMKDGVVYKQNGAALAR